MTKVDQELDDLKLMASGIGVTMTPMPVQIIHCSTLLSDFLKHHPECIGEVVRFAVEHCGKQRHTRAVMSASLAKIGKEKISPQNITKIQEWQNYENDDLILKDLQTLN